MTILEKTMREMPKTFTSNEFNKRALKNGYSERILKNKGLATFINIYACNGYSGSKTWTKRENVNYKSSNIELSDEQMIKHLKSKGYKIMKPVNDWIEC